MFIRGNAISGAPIITGTSQFPNPPISAGITTKNYISNPCAVINTLYNCPFPAKIPGPVLLYSIRINKLIVVAITPAQLAKIRYYIPMSLALVLQHQRKN